MKNPLSCIHAAFVVLILLICTADPLPSQGIVGFDSVKWNIINGKTVDHLGRKAFMGNAMLKDVIFQNGVIEVDIATKPYQRSYPGVGFRAQDMRNYERLYIRPHRTVLYNDAIQYVATFNGIDGWQLFYGEGMSAQAEIPPDTWNHLKIEVHGMNAKIYWNTMDDPIMIINDLQHGASSGSLGVMGPVDGSAYFSNFSYRIDTTVYSGALTLKEKTIGIISDWDISQPFRAIDVDIEQTPDEQGLYVQWQKVHSQPDGLVDLSRYFGRTNALADVVYAKTTLHADTDTIRQLSFGYSDYIVVYSGGKPVFFGNSAYQQRDRSFLGIVGYNDAVYLPLREGDNELMISVTEAFGGWGFKFREANASYRHPALTKKWEMERMVKVPESVVYDKQRDVLYVTSYFNGGKEGIARVKLDGVVDKSDWITGLVRPTGMTIYNDKLYVLDRTRLCEIDIEQGAIVNAYPIPGAVFVNDLAFDSRGTAYITDTERDAIYVFKGGKFESWLGGTAVDGANTLWIENNTLFIGVSGEGCIKAIDLGTKEMKTFVTLGKGSNPDGFKPDGNGNYLVGDYNGRLFLVTPDGEKEELLNTKDAGQTLADFEYIQGKHLLIIPTLFDNRIVAFTLNTR